MREGTLDNETLVPFYIQRRLVHVPKKRRTEFLYFQLMLFHASLRCCIERLSNMAKVLKNWQAVERDVKLKPYNTPFNNCHNICTNTIFPISSSGYTRA